MNKKRIVLYLLIFLIIVVSDRYTKKIIDKKIPLYGKITVIKGFFNIHKVYNDGLVFGFLSGEKNKTAKYLLNSLSIVALLIFFFIYLKWEKTFLTDMFFTFIVAGALGNIYDKVAYGYVIDFLDFYIGKYHWPFFNVADSFITIGLLGFVFYEIFWRRDVSNTN